MIVGMSPRSREVGGHTPEVSVTRGRGTWAAAALTSLLPAPQVLSVRQRGPGGLASGWEVGGDRTAVPAPSWKSLLLSSLPAPPQHRVGGVGGSQQWLASQGLLPASPRTETPPASHPRGREWGVATPLTSPPQGGVPGETKPMHVRNRFPTGPWMQCPDGLRMKVPIRCQPLCQAHPVVAGPR